MSNSKSDFDTPWKKIFDLYFEQFIAYCWPEKYLEIDWQKGYKMLDKELNKITKNAPIGNRVVDKLIEIYRKSGEEAYVLIHLEIQGNYDKKFEERMYVYHYRLWDSYRKPIASLAVLIDRDERWRPSTYRETFWGTKIEMQFPIIKLLDYRVRIEELKASPNPFAMVILAQLAALEKHPFEAQLKAKINLIRWLYKHSWQREDIHTLLIFIDWVLALPEVFELRCREAIGILEEELHVDYIPSFERIAIQKGMQQGIEQGMQQGMQQGESTLLLRLLQRKFNDVPDNYRQRIQSANTETLLTWADRVLDSKTLEEIFKV